MSKKTSTQGKKNSNSSVATFQSISFFLLCSLGFATPSNSAELTQHKRSASIVLPDLGTGSNGRFIDHAPLRRLGENAWMNLQKESAWLEDPVLTHYLTQLVTQLAAHSPTPVTIRGIGVINDPSINAFAMPGGFIVIHTGLLLKVDTEDELASVLGHEIAHLSQAHIDRLWETQEKSQWGVLAAILLGIYSGSTGRFDTANALITSGLGAGQQQQIQHSQQAETEADDVGLDILTAAGFSAMGSVRMMDRLARQRTEDVNSRYFTTHPLSSERVRRLRDRTLGSWSSPQLAAQKSEPVSLLSFTEVQAHTRKLLAQQSNLATEVDVCLIKSTSKRFLPTWQMAQCQLQNIASSDQSEKHRQTESSLREFYEKSPSFLIAQPLALLLKKQGKTQEALLIIDQTLQIETQTSQLITQAQAWWLRAQLNDTSSTEQRIALTHSYLARLDCGEAQEQFKLLKQQPKKTGVSTEANKASIQIDLLSLTQQINRQCPKD